MIIKFPRCYFWNHSKDANGKFSFSSVAFCVENCLKNLFWSHLIVFVEETYYYFQFVSFSFFITINITFVNQKWVRKTIQKRKMPIQAGVNWLVRMKNGRVKNFPYCTLDQTCNQTKPKRGRQHRLVIVLHIFTRYLWFMKTFNRRTRRKEVGKKSLPALFRGSLF